MSFSMANASEINKKMDKLTIHKKIKIMTINVESGDNGADAKTRRECFPKIIERGNPDILLVQECNSEDIKVIEDYLKAEHTKMPINEVAVLVKKGKKFNNFVSIPMEKYERLALCKLTLLDGKSFYIGSWHGPYKIKDKEKEEEFKLLYKRMEEVSKEADGKVYNWIVGGDFNYDVKEAKACLEKELFQAQIVSTKDEIVYFLCSSGITQLTQKSTSHNVKESKEGGPILDHTPATITIDI